MEKLYFQNLGALDFVLFGIYGLAFLLLIDQLVKRLGYSRIDRKAAVISYLILLSFVLLDYFFNLVFYAPDAKLYSEMILGDFEQWPPDPEMQRMKGFGKLLSIVFLKKPILYISFCSFLVLTSGLILWEAVKQRVSQMHYLAFPIFIVLIACLPSVLAYGTMPSREVWIVFSLAAFIWSLNFINSKGKQWYCLIPVLLLWFFRPGMMVIAVFSLCLIFAHSWKEIWWKKLAIFTPLSIVALWITHVKLFPIFSLSSLQYKRNEAVTRSSWEDDTYGMVDWSSWIDVLRDIPLLVLQLLTAPFALLEGDPFKHKLSGLLDASILMILLVLLLIKIRTSFKVFPQFLIFLSCFVICLGFYEYHYMGAVRHRMGMTLLVAAMAVWAWTSSNKTVKA